MKHHFKFSFKNFLTLLLLSMLPLACSEENEVTVAKLQEETAATALVPTTPKDVLASDIAKRLATALTSVDVRNFLKKEITKQFDGDYDALFMKIKDEKISINKNGRVQSLTFVSY